MAKIPSRNKAKTNLIYIECPYCRCKWLVSEDTEADRYIYSNTVIHYCRECGEEFVANVTKDIKYKYS